MTAASDASTEALIRRFNDAFQRHDPAADRRGDGMREGHVSRARLSAPRSSSR